MFLFALLDALFGAPPSSGGNKPKKNSYDSSWEEECDGCGEHFEDCSCSDCDDDDCNNW